TAADARRGLALIDSGVRKTLVDESDYYFTRGKINAQPSAASAFLLPVYDEYNVAYKQRHIALDSTNNKPEVSTWGMLGPNVMLGGRIVGTWKATIDKSAVVILVNAGRALTKPERSAIAKAAERYATFLGFTAEWLTFAIQTC